MKKSFMSDSSNLKKYSSLKTYMRNILKTSLITSIPEITVAKSWVKRGIKIIVFCLCLVGFIYQTLHFLALYLSYPTVVNVLVSNPFEVVQPAITVCNRNRMRRSYICTKYPEKCDFVEKEGFCVKYPNFCSSPLYLGIPKIESTERHWEWDDVLQGAHNSSIIDWCFKVNEGRKTPCDSHYRTVPVVTASGEPNLCYVIESQWGKPDSKPDMYPNTFSVVLEFLTEPAEYVIPTASVLVQIAVHERKRLVNPYEEGQALRAGVQYEGTVTMTEKQLLPHPYSTNCTDYIKLWKENNGTGPLNDLMCIENCKLNSVLQQGKCVDKNVAYPNMEEICPKDEVTVTSDIIEECSKVCGNPCSDQSYEVRYSEVSNFKHVCKNPYCEVRRTRLEIFFKKFRVTKFLYQPKFESVEMFSYIGGYMGMWLGLSLVSLFDLFQTISSIAYFPIGRFWWRREKQKMKASAGNLFGNNVYYNARAY